MIPTRPIPPPPPDFGKGSLRYYNHAPPPSPGSTRLGRVGAAVRDARRVLGTRGSLAIGSLAAVSVGCAMERLSLGLIVPGVFVLAAMVYSHIRGGRGGPDA